MNFALNSLNWNLFQGKPFRFQGIHFHAAITTTETTITTAATTTTKSDFKKDILRKPFKGSTLTPTNC